jgi:hypothetical protein
VNRYRRTSVSRLGKREHDACGFNVAESRRVNRVSGALWWRAIVSVVGRRGCRKESLLKRLSSVAALAAAGVLAVTASPALAAKPASFCPAHFTSGSVEQLADILTGFATVDQIRTNDRNGDDQLCWFHITGIGYQVIDDVG